MNNTKIAKQLIEATKPQYTSDELNWYAEDIVKTHNYAAKYGFVELPLLDYHGVEHDGDKIIISVRPKCGMADLNDLFNIKTAWGADSIEIMTCENPAICITFNIK